MRANENDDSHKNAAKSATASSSSSISAPTKAVVDVKDDNLMKSTEGSDMQAPSYPSGGKLWITYVATLLTMFLVPLDMTIVATAIPTITEEFRSLDEAGWYGSAFFLTLAVFQAPWGKVYKYYSVRLAYALSVAIFEFGSLICGVSRNSQMLIAGRVITGCGGAGITIGTLVIVSHLVPPTKAPAFIGGIGAAFSIASVVGPLVGGAFTEEVTWRWCFYINLPIGGAAAIIFFFLFPKPKAAPPRASLKEKLLQLDPLGTTFIIASVVCYFLALEWGGVRKAWDSADVIGTLIGFVLLFFAFAGMQFILKDRASINPKLLFQRHVAGCSAFSFLIQCANFLLIYTLPLYFQSVKGESPTRSGILVLPLIVSASVFVVLSGILFTKLPYFQAYLFFGAAITAIGAGLLYTLRVDSCSGAYLGYQFVLGIGNGVCQQIPVTVVQAHSKPEDLATSMGIVMFFQIVSGALSVAAAQSVFINRLLSTITQRLPDVDPASIIATGAIDLQRTFPEGQLAAIRQSYLDGLHAAWAMAIAFAGAAVLVGLTLGWKRIEMPKGPGADNAVNDEEIAEKGNVKTAPTV